MDGELVVWDAAGRLAFERLQNRLARRGHDRVALPRRRTASESVFAAQQLSAPWALRPSTTDLDIVRGWLTWASVGMEGVVVKRLTDAYQPSVRGWQKYKVRETSAAIGRGHRLPDRPADAAARQARP
ncbi:hypothetical protein [Streptomyces sp. NPDC046870]|uniref:hypothetical protein n=1 Tax=Streptomyces sp. NPDC046870 TaxID=3155135 RepID=UPI0034562E57